ncbi:DUF2786 domain-containing protein [Nocardioides sp. zg-DK7169]|uniref:DUF2786 domain-containing protein n=1 Tax=Nocardioides sp. zg-DK7169 TaxID=2736600 RepID=UPI0015575B13|nr:DUF2786 domain-containing protein [Nocardioides sp. zg-DK7169]NPC98022.1 DUF2786 domain-containing protein [Nocardioides sp. zg-DK7169]
MSTTGPPLLDDQHPILAKVRKLLAKAEDPAATEHEAEVYTAKATALIASYGVDAALLSRADPAADPVGDLQVGVDAPYAADKADLLATVATALRCQVVMRTRRGPDGKEISLHVFGHRSDLERAEIIWTSLLLQSATGLLRTPVPRGEHPAAFRRSWLAGFRLAVGRRLTEAEDRARLDADARQGDGPGASLVLADRGELVRGAVEAAYPDARAARARTLSGSGGADGWAAGQRADLGARRMPRAPRALRR